MDLEHIAVERTVRFSRFLGVVTLACTALYALPRTALLGAVMLTGLFGGGIATHLRVDSPLLSHTLFGVYLGAMVWGGLIFRRRTVAPALFSGA